VLRERQFARNTVPAILAMVALQALVLRQQQHFTSVGFSGAGFLACYHLGVVQCLRDQGLLHCALEKDKVIPLTGVSAGALTAVAIAADIEPSDCMSVVLSCAHKAREAGRLNTWQPGFSLVDVVEHYTQKMLLHVDEEAFLHRIDHGKRLRIGLTDRRVFPPIRNRHAECYVDRYRGLQDAIAVCVLSSFVPGWTGPVQGRRDTTHRAVSRAAQRLDQMIEFKCVKRTITDAPIRLKPEDSTARETCWDGGLVNAFPIFDARTLLVTPIAAHFPSHSICIHPGMEYDSANVHRFAWTDRVHVHWTAANAYNFRCLLASSEPDVLHAKFSQGYDNATRYLKQHGIRQTYTAPVVSPSISTNVVQ
jgi:hypothetical protein